MKEIRAQVKDKESSSPKAVTADTDTLPDSLVMAKNKVENSTSEILQPSPSQQFELERDVTNHEQPVSQSIPIVQQGASSLAYHPGASS